MEGDPPPRAIRAAPRHLGALAEPGLDLGGQAGGLDGLPPQIRAGGVRACALQDGGGMRLLGAAPPCALPGISPSRGEIGSFDSRVYSATLEIGESRRDVQSPPSRGEMSGRTEGVLSRRPVSNWRPHSAAPSP